jgi:hypothetical protein
VFSTDPAIRGQYTASLRDLADFLDAHPDLPVPMYGTTITVNADGADDGGKTQVDAAAEQLGTPIHDDIEDSGHYSTIRAFGRIGYDVVAISDASFARYLAHGSYYDCVAPNE